ncbi:MAG: hypothetical protein II877_00830 [Synergistaceae bacterium]|nr:hypothetical protein [Synergistaceae bacterium]MBQ7168425.1 hypothetical protein [Synergistaceae bacterium]
MLTVHFDTQDIARLQLILSSIPGNSKKIQRQLQRELIKSAKKIIPPEASKVYWIKQARVRKAITTSGMNVILRGTRQNLADFHVSPSRPGKRRKNGLKAAVMRRGGMKAIRHGFLIHGRGSGKILAMVRTGKGRTDYEPLTSPAIPQMMENEEVQSAVTERLKQSAIDSLHILAGRLLAGR